MITEVESTRAVFAATIAFFIAFSNASPDGLGVDVSVGEGVAGAGEDAAGEAAAELPPTARHCEQRNHHDYCDSH